MRRGIGLGISIFLLCLILMFLGMGKAFAQPQVLERPLVPLEVEKYVPGEIIVKFKPGVRDEVISELNRRLGTSVLYTSPFAGFKRLKIPKGKTVEEMVNIYKRNPNVEYAEPNFIAYALWAPNDEYYFYQWHLDNPEYGGINMEAAWDLFVPNGGTNPVGVGAGVTVAVIDTGVTAGTDLADTCFVQGYDFVNDDSDPTDDNGHGTHVAGTIAQSTNNGIGVAGVAFNACLMPVKVLDQNGSGNYADVADGIYFAAGDNPINPDAPVADIPADVINLSLGGPEDDSQTLKIAIADAYNNGVTIVAAAGNDGLPSLSYPAAYDAYVIAVGATCYDETLAYYSNYGSSLDLVAPGGDQVDGVLQQTFLSFFGFFICCWDYYFMAGTSCACPHVSGVAALVIANGNADANGDGVTSPYEVRVALQETAECLGEEECPNDTYGYGLVDAAAALGYTPGPVPNQPPVADDQSVVTNEDTPVNITLTASDPDGDLLTYYIVSSPSKGKLTGTAPDIIYTPNTNYNGSDNFTFKANDGKANSNIATVNITVTPVNDAPVANDQSVTTEEGTPVDIILTGSDVDGDTLSFTIVTNPSNGALTGTAPNITYTPNSGFTGSDSFTFTVTDGEVNSNLANVSITVNPVAQIMYIEDIDMRPGGHIDRGRWTWYKALATVLILDSSGNPVAEATVEGHWSGAYSGNVSGITGTDGNNGKVTFETKWVKGGGEFTFTVDGVTKKDWLYDPFANMETSDSITVP